MRNFSKWLACLLFMIFAPIHVSQGAEKPLGQSTKQKINKPAKKKAASNSVNKSEKKKNKKTTSNKKSSKKNPDAMSAKPGIDQHRKASRIVEPKSQVDSFNSSTPHNSSLEEIAAKSIGFLIIPFLLVTVLMGVSMWKIFVKAGREGWEAFIPILNAIRMVQIARMPMWAIVFCFVPVLNIIFPFWLSFALAKSFNKSAGYALGLVFLPVFFYPHLAFSSSAYGNSFDSGLDSAGLRMAS